MAAKASSFACGRGSGGLLGNALFNNSLFYANGGGAFGHEPETLHVNFANAIGDAATSKDLTGYAVGGGIETMGRLERRGRISVHEPRSISGSGDFSVQGSPLGVFSNSTARDHIVRVGADYHFGAAPY